MSIKIRSKIKVGVLRGGIGLSYNASLKTGEKVLSSLDKQKYQPVDLLVTGDGIWHLRGIPVAVEELSRSVDVVFNTLPGARERKFVREVLDGISIPSTGSVFPKRLTKADIEPRLRDINVRVPIREIIVDSGLEGEEKKKTILTTAKKAFNRIPMPWLISSSSGSKRIANSFSELMKIIGRFTKDGHYVMIEEDIAGCSAVCCLIDNFRGEKTYTLLPAEIRKAARGTEIICPGNFSYKEKVSLSEGAIALHRQLDLRHYSQVNFLVSPKRGVFVQDIHVVPSLTSKSPFLRSLEAVGCRFPEFVDHVVQSALEK